MNCSAGSYFVADVCLALGATEVYALLESEDEAHEVVFVKYGDKEWTQESGFNTYRFSEELLTANKPDLSKTGSDGR